jgi:tetratricopeptide (TPR) repeat protein
VKRTKNVGFYLAGLVAVITLIVYLPTLWNGFIGAWDDNDYVIENKAIRFLNIDFFRWAFFHSYKSNWHPLTWISHAFDYAVWGLNPLGHHLTSIVLHALNTFLVVLFVIRILEAWRENMVQTGWTSFLNQRAILTAAGITGLLFGLHPVHVESVAWISERKDLLCALFYLLSVNIYIKYAGANKNIARQFFHKDYLTALGLFLLALMSKPMAVSLPVVLLVLDWVPLGRIRSARTLWGAFAEKLPFFSLSLALSIVTILAQKGGLSVASLQALPFLTRLLVAVRSVILYIFNLLFPLRLAPFYPYPKSVSLFSPDYFSAIIVLIGITVISARMKKTFWVTAWACYLITLVPVLGIIQVGGQSMADRYMYIPSISLFVLAGIGGAWTAEWLNKRSWHAAGKVVCLVVGFFLFSSMTYATVEQIGLWKNSFLLWDYAIRNGFYSAPAYNNRALAFEEQGNPDRAIADFQEAIRLDATYYLAFNNLGALYGSADMPDKAIEAFSRSIELQPNDSNSYFNRGVAYSVTGKLDEALADFTKTIELNPNDADAYTRRAKLYLRAGNSARANGDLEKACLLGSREACYSMR